MIIITAFAILYGGGAQTRRALLIGISAYDTQQTQWNPIHGTNDVALLRTALRHCGVTDISELRDAGATYKGVCLATQRSYELRLLLRGKDFYCGPLSYIIYKVLRGSSKMLSSDASWVRQVKRRFASALPANNPQRLVIETTQTGIQ